MIVIVQGITCLGKTTLCRQLEKELPDCKHFCLDTYKESIWDKFGFDSTDQRQSQVDLASKLFCSDIREAISHKVHKYVLIDYVFTNELWSELMYAVGDLDIRIKTIYLKPTDYEEHCVVWEQRSRNFSIRHPGHGATHYHNGKGTDYINVYKDKVFKNLPTTSQTLEVSISFNPYKRSVSYESIKNFIQEQ